MKRIVFLLFLGFLFINVSVGDILAQEFTCLEMVNGQLTGNTIVLTVENLPDDVVKVTRSIRPSSSGDQRAVYNTTSSPSVFSGSEVTIQGNGNTYFIPFEGDLFVSVSITFNISCPCSVGDTDCGLAGSLIDRSITCGKEPCAGCCELTLEVPAPSGPNNLYSFGPALILEASDFILVDNID